MEFALLMLIPALAVIVSASPAGRQLAAPVTIAAMVAVLALAVAVAAGATRHNLAAFGETGFACDALGALVLLLVALVGLTASLFSWGYLRHGRHGGGEKVFYALFNLFVLSMLAVPIVANLALIWIAVELTTLMSAFLVGFEDTPEALEAAWKYVVLTSLGAVLALLGFLILYWGLRAGGGGPFTWAGLATVAPRMPPVMLWAAFLLILVGFGTKVGLVPMHTWLPDAHSQAPAPICALLSGVETTAVLYVILRLLPLVEVGPGLDARPWLVGFGLVSVGTAALLLIYVRDFKRLFAFSTVEHMGIIAVAAGLGGAEAHLAAAYQITGHAIAKSFCFFAAGLVAMTTGTQEIAAVRGLVRSSPLSAAALVAGAIAIAGAPPFALFVSELSILKTGMQTGQYIAAGLLGLFIVVAFCAVMRHVNRMAFGIAENSAVAAAAPLSCKLTVVLAAIPLVTVGIWIPGPLMALLRAAAAAMGG
jgi:hydrogenase-4 component F